jgi:hypothetical protein
MRIKNLIILLLILLPLIFGVLASFVAQVLWNPVPILLFKIDVGILAFLAGLSVTLVLLAFRWARRGMKDDPEN